MPLGLSVMLVLAGIVFRRRSLCFVGTEKALREVYGHWYYRLLKVG